MPSSPSTYRRVAAAMAVVLLFGAATPLVSHVCAMAGRSASGAPEPCCCEEGAADAATATDAPQCHPMPAQQPVSQHAVEDDCCTTTVDQHDVDGVLSSKQASHDFTVAVEAPGPDVVPPELPVTAYGTPVRGPPPPPGQPLFILHASFLN